MRISDWSSDVCSSDLLNWLAPLRGLAFYGSAGYADAYYVHYPDAPACAVTSQCPRTNADGTTQNLSGRPLANAPRWTAAAVPSFTTLLPGVGWAPSPAPCCFAAVASVISASDEEQLVGGKWGGDEG